MTTRRRAMACSLLIAGLLAAPAAKPLAAKRLAELGIK